MNYEIIHLPKEQWKGHPLPIGYTTEEYYDVTVDRSGDGFTIQIKKQKADTPITHTPEEYDFPDKLYEDWWEKACAWGVLADGKLVAAIETCPEDWSNRLRITELWVAPDYQKQGIGHDLMEVAKEQARLERRRAVILETQSCNVNAIDFYMHEGFTVIGLDTCCYANNDLSRKEVRVEMGYLRERKIRLTREEVEIREEQPKDYHNTEQIVQEAFWNKFQQGCDEHYLVHLLRSHEAYLPQFSRIAVKDGEVIGMIMYTKAWVKADEKTGGDHDGKTGNDDGADRSGALTSQTQHQLVTFGPLCVSPKWQGMGVGELLLQETMKLVADAGYPGIVIFGEPDYYPRVGFQTCDHFGITTADGGNSKSFMGIELKPGAMKDIHGKFYESDVFENLSKEAAEKYNDNFPLRKKQYFPMQW